MKAIGVILWVLGAANLLVLLAALYAWVLFDTEWLTFGKTVLLLMSGITAILLGYIFNED